MNIGHALFGWKKSDFGIYEEIFYKYGGSINTHPDIVRFFINKKGGRFRFWHYIHHDEIKGAYFDVDSKFLALNVWREYPVSYDEIVLPVEREQKIILPQKTNRISSIHKGTIRNSFFSFTKKREVCLVKNAFSSKTIRKRNGEMKNFLSSGGEIFRLEDMSAQDIADLYVHLFRLRFGERIRCYEKNKIVELLGAIPHLVFGNALFYKGNPCAIDIVLCGGNKDMLYFDVPNGGFDPELGAFSPGSLLMWQNICDAREVCKTGNQKMIFSIGLYEKNWEYKRMWADVFPTGKTLAI